MATARASVSAIRTVGPTGAPSDAEDRTVRHIPAVHMGAELGFYLAQGFEIESAADGWVLLSRNRHRIELHAASPRSRSPCSPGYARTRT